MPRWITRALDRAHHRLVGAVERLATGHEVLVSTASERLIQRSVRPVPDEAEEKPKAKATKSKDAKGAQKATPRKAGEGTEFPKKEEALEDSEGAGKDGKKTKEKGKGGKKETAARASYRPGPRRMIAAAAHWTVEGEGALDFLLRAALLSGGLVGVGYFARPLLSFLAALHPAFASLFLVVLLAVEFAPTLAVLLVLCIASTLTTPVLWWPAALGGVVVAWWAGAPSKEAEETAPESLPEDTVEELPDTPAQAVARWLCLTIGDRGGIHLQELYPAMRNLPGQQHRTNRDLRALLRGMDIPVEHSIRVGGIGGRSGVYLASVLPLLSPREESRGEFREDAVQSTYSSPLSGVESGVESGGEGFSDMVPPPRLSAYGPRTVVTAGTRGDSTP